MNNAINSDSILTDIFLYYNGNSNFTLQNFEFNGCDLFFKENLTLTTPEFRGVNRIRLGAGKTLTITNGVGTLIYYNNNITLSTSGTVPAELKGVATANLGV